MDLKFIFIMVEKDDNEDLFVGLNQRPRRGECNDLPIHYTIYAHYGMPHLILIL